MSRPISESVSLLNETLTNCKTNLKDKGVEADTIKISDVDEKITEIQAGGSSNEIDFTQFNCEEISNGALLLIFEQISEVDDIDWIKINNENLGSNFWLKHINYPDLILLIFPQKTYQEPVTMNIAIAYDGGQSKYRFDNITLKPNTLIVVGQSGDYYD